MKYKFIYFLAFFLLMLTTGVFWGTWFTLTRSIDNFSPEEFIHIGQVIILNVALPMRFILPLTLLFMLLSLWFYADKKSTGFYMGIISFGLIILVLLITLLILVPIDNSIKTWTAETIPPDFPNLRSRWSGFHTLRTVDSLAGFACFTWFVLTAKGHLQINPK